MVALFAEETVILVVKTQRGNARLEGFEPNYSKGGYGTDIQATAHAPLFLKASELVRHCDRIGFRTDRCGAEEPREEEDSETRSSYARDPGCRSSEAISGRQRSVSTPLGSSSIDSRGPSEALYGANLRILCLNAYLVPPSISWNPYLWAPFWSCKRPYQRAEEIGRLSTQYDVTCLQEVWGANVAAMNAYVLPTHSILPETQSGSRFSCVGELIDPVRFFFNKTGGLWFSWRRSKCALISMARHYFPSGSQVPFSNQNVTAIELDVSPVFPNHRLVVLNTHFSVLGLEPRRQNLDALKTFIKELAWKAYLLYLGRQLDAGIDTANSLAGPKVPPSFLKDVSVLLCGDFNIDPDRTPRQYRRLTTLDGDAVFRDLFLPENNPNYPHQYTYFTQETLIEMKKKHSVSRKGNSLYPWPFRGRVDYMFAVDEVRLSAKEVISLVRKFPPEAVVGDDYEEMDIPVLKDGSLTISFERIYCLGMDIVAQKQGSELSDHWPLSARITVGAPTIEVEQLPRPRKWQLLRGDSFCFDSSYVGASTEGESANLADHSTTAENRWRRRHVTSLRDEHMSPVERAHHVQKVGYKERFSIGTQNKHRARQQRLRTERTRGSTTTTARITTIPDEVVESDDEEKRRWGGAELAFFEADVPTSSAVTTDGGVLLTAPATASERGDQSSGSLYAQYEVESEPDEPYS
ncbi:endonuclease/exonuclease/phosphatase family protein [Besnoitia besnoiti]|uniref:Endonuclease/exonuclease/phosphatase family protein n=1 Tax=Besnoitia besnoiti TaxID=94643 RepID=A0A2A9M6Q7_BESBE|nr:endonuclease/exonuclease/phosphatase family protein [Besnoitia besnoiti]PFH34158.1 endonuclease/exonuclease/phosphatase family protein [Besnoitia besnoiti]